MNRRRIHILYEHGTDLRPFGSAYVRLLRPLTHPAVCESLEVTSGLRYNGQEVDGVIVDRLWRPDISPVLVESLVEDVRRVGARLIYALDDNLLDLPAEQKDWRPTKEHLWVVQFLLREADGVLVPTQPLRERLSAFNRNIVVMRHALDERLLIRTERANRHSPFSPERKVIGYMGTVTHDDDLLMILPALRRVSRRHPERIGLQILGVVGRADTLQALSDLPVRLVSPRPEENEYPLFMLWFSGRVHWDIAIAPLRDSPFTRCKSDIKFLDYGAIGAAGIYSRVPAYESSVRHLQTGWLAENHVGAWAEALEALLSNDGLRMQLARNASRYLYAERVLAVRAGDWVKALENLLEGT